MTLSPLVLSFWLGSGKILLEQLRGKRNAWSQRAPTQRIVSYFLLCLDLPFISWIKKNAKQTFFLLSTQFSKWNRTMFRWHPLIMLWLVQKGAWSAKSPVPQMCLLRQRFQRGVTISLLPLQSRRTCMCVYICAHTHTHIHTHTCSCICVWVSVCESETVRKKSLWAFGCSTGEDKVVWCLLTWPMIHNWGRTAVAGCTDRFPGWMTDDRALWGQTICEPKCSLSTICSPILHKPPWYM